MKEDGRRLCCVSDSSVHESRRRRRPTRPKLFTPAPRLLGSSLEDGRTGASISPDAPDPRNVKHACARAQRGRGTLQDAIAQELWLTRDQVTFEGPGDL